MNSQPNTSTQSPESASVQSNGCSVLNAEIRRAADLLYGVLYNSNASHRAITLSTGHVMTGEKIYRRSGRVGWTAWYGLKDADGKSLLGGIVGKNEIVRMTIKKLS